jgi:hypothetical protein
MMRLLSDENIDYPRGYKKIKGEWPGGIIRYGFTSRRKQQFCSFRSPGK